MESGRARFNFLRRTAVAGEERRKHEVNNHLYNSSFSGEEAVPEVADFPRMAYLEAISAGHRKSPSISALKTMTPKPSATSPSARPPRTSKTERSKGIRSRSKRA